MKIKNKRNLTDLLDKQMYKKDIIYLLKILSEEDLFIPFNNNHLIELYTSDNKLYIPLFTSKKQTSGLIYTRLDKVKLEIVIKDIYSLGKYHAISINPFTNDFILNKKMIGIVKSINNIWEGINKPSFLCKIKEMVVFTFDLWYLHHQN